MSSNKYRLTTNQNIYLYQADYQLKLSLSEFCSNTQNFQTILKNIVTSLLWMVAVYIVQVPLVTQRNTSSPHLLPESLTYWYHCNLLNALHRKHFKFAFTIIIQIENNTIIINFAIIHYNPFKSPSLPSFPTLLRSAWRSTQLFRLILCWEVVSASLLHLFYVELYDSS